MAAREMPAVLTLRGVKAREAFTPMVGHAGTAGLARSAHFRQAAPLYDPKASVRPYRLARHDASEGARHAAHRVALPSRRGSRRDHTERGEEVLTLRGGGPKWVLAELGSLLASRASRVAVANPDAYVRRKGSAAGVVGRRLVKSTPGVPRVTPGSDPKHPKHGWGSQGLGPPARRNCHSGRLMQPQHGGVSGVSDPAGGRGGRLR